jgi:hypothetical protein
MCLWVSYEKLNMEKINPEGDPDLDSDVRCGSGSAPKCHGSPTLFFIVQLLIEKHVASVVDRQYFDADSDPALKLGHRIPVIETF